MSEPSAEPPANIDGSLAEYQAAVVATGEAAPSRFEVMMRINRLEGESLHAFARRLNGALAHHVETPPELPLELRSISGACPPRDQHCSVSPGGGCELHPSGCPPFATHRSTL